MGVGMFQRGRSRQTVAEVGEQSPATPNPLQCPKCGKVCKLKVAYFQHVKACTNDEPGLGI